jgi:hypothetical protein
MIFQGYFNTTKLIFPSTRATQHYGKIHNANDYIQRLLRIILFFAEYS